LLDQFATSFNQAHQVLVNDIFSSERETNDLGMNAQKLVSAIKPHQSQVFYCPDQPATLTHLKTNLKTNDAIITMGAGDNWLWHKSIIKLIKAL